jgi:cyclopropane fatty-acyl-phospholipid synthase-like methyltransferase
MTDEGFIIEFGRYSEWLAGAIEELDPVDRIPSACRGTANPALFDLVARSVGIAPGMRILDVGSGLGGPATWLSTTHDCTVVGVDVMASEVAAAHRLFPEHTAIAAHVSALPFRSASFDGAWALGVLEMIEDKCAALSEVRRVLKPGASLGIYGFVKKVPALIDPPSSDHFEDPEVVAGVIEEAGLNVTSAGPVPSHDRPPENWSRAIEAVRARVKSRYRDHPDLGRVDAELRRFNRLRREHQIEAWTLVATKPRPR